MLSGKVLFLQVIFMAIFQVKGLEVSFGERVLFGNVDFKIEKNDKIGLAGTNGAGKTTLLKLLCGDVPEDYSGEIVKGADTVIGYMEQHVIRDGSVTVRDEVMSVFKSLIDAETELEKLHQQIDAGDNDAQTLERQMRLTEEFHDRGGLTFRARTESMLGGMGFSEDARTKPISVLSGGERSKIQLVKLLLSEANLLLLDEPTNHLDISATEWLEKFLIDFKGAYVLISHDRYFLDRVTDRTFALDNLTLTAYPGNYTNYLKLYDERVTFLKKKYAEDMEEIKRIEAIIEQQKRFNQEHNYVTIKSKLHQIERIKATLVPPPPERKRVKFAFPCTSAHGTDVVTARDVSFEAGEKTLFSGLGFEIKYGDRVFLMGPNGCGKSSLVKLITGAYPLKTGKIDIARWVSVGYFDQLQEVRLQSSKPVIDEIWDEFPQFNRTQVQSALAVFRIEGEEVFRPVNTLSGGEAAKVVLLKIILKQPNLLLFDEPTNHLDLEAREGLIEALESYTGTMFIISHDRRLINKIATKLFFLNEDGIEVFEGNYDQWQAQRTDVPEQSSAKKPEKPQSSYVQQKELQSRIRRAKKRSEKIEEEISSVETRISELNELNLNGGLHYEDIVKNAEEIEALTARQDELLNEWGELDDFLAENAE